MSGQGGALRTVDATVLPEVAAAPGPRWEAPSRLAAAIDAVAECESRHERARRVLQQASNDFALVDAELRNRLAELRQLLPVGAGDPAGDAAVRLAEPRPRRRPAHPAPAEGLPPLSITCFGGFEVRREGCPVRLCANRNGQAVLRYLTVQPHHRATVDALMELLWPDDPPRVARHKLHCAFSSLRRSLNDGHTRQPGGGYLACVNGVYELRPLSVARIDVDEFLERYRAGQRTGGDAAAEYYEAACRLYRGPFLPEDLYADWSLLQREQLARTHLAMCDALAAHHLAAGRHAEAAGWAWRVLGENPCGESACRVLLRALPRIGRRDEAVRAYRRYERALREELDLQPTTDMARLFGAAAGGDLDDMPA